MDRYMIVEGVEGCLVTDPSAQDPTRYAGMTRKPLEERKNLASGQRHTPRKVAMLYHPHLVKAVSKGSLKQFGAYVYANSSTEALASVGSKSKAKPKARSEKAETHTEKGNG